MKKRLKEGFTLIEMLVVIGIIAVLSGSLIIGMGRIRKSAQRTKAQETVSNAASALGIIFQTEMNWPKLLVNNNNKQLDARTSHVFVRFGLLGLSYDTKQYNASSRKGKIVLIGADRCGVVDPWAITTLKRNSSASEGSGEELKVDTGGTVKDHILWYAIDEDGDGVTEADVNGTAVKVRAPACVWCAGADGELGPYKGKRTKASADDVYSWSRGQEVE